MEINYYFSDELFEAVFDNTRLKVLNKDEFEQLADYCPTCKLWSKVLIDNFNEMAKLSGILNLVYYAAENIVLPRAFDQADFIKKLNFQMNTMY